MNYSMVVDPAKTTSNFINLRTTPSLSGVDIGDFARGQVAEGDELVLSADGKQWLNVLMIDGVLTTVPTYAAAWLCTVTENPAVPPNPTVQVDLTFVSATPITIVANGIPVGTYTGTIELVASG